MSTPSITTRSGTGPTRTSAALDRAMAGFSRWLNRYSIEILRVSLGVVFLGFGVLKFIPDASPAQDLVVRTLTTLSAGILPDQAALLLCAVAECFIGLTLISGKLLRSGLVVLGGSLVGIMSPLVLFFTDLFPGAPTLEAQYVFKDIVLVAAGLVISARVLGAKLVPASATSERSSGSADAHGDGHGTSSSGVRIPSITGTSTSSPV